jgi:hypothetical protein
VFISIISNMLCESLALASIEIVAARAISSSGLLDFDISFITSCVGLLVICVLYY